KPLSCDSGVSSSLGGWARYDEYKTGIRDESEARRRRQGRMALLRRRQYAGPDRGDARHFKADGAAAGFARRVRGADQGPRRPPDRQLPRTRGEAAVAFRTGPGGGGADRPDL